MNAEIGYKVDQLVCGNVSQIDLLQIFHCWYGVKHNPQKMVTLRQLFKFPDGEPGPGGKGILVILEFARHLKDNL